MSDIDSIIKTIEGAVNKFAGTAEAKQPALAKSIMGLVKDLETDGDALLNNVNNLKKIYAITAKIGKLILDDSYKGALTDFAGTYQTLQGLHNDYFAKFNAKFKPKKVFEAVTKAAVDSTLNGLTEAGLEVGVTDGVKKILQQNIGAGGSYSEMTDNLRGYIITNKDSEGALSRYVRTYATTAINQYSAEYNKTVSEDLGLEWYGYDGSLLTTSRPFCEKMVEKEYIHKSEFKAVLSGDMGEAGKVPLNKTTGLPSGLMEGTTPDNLIRRRGGWNCGHQMIAVDESVVPKETRDAVYNSAAYKAWAAAEGKKPEAAAAPPQQAPPALIAAANKLGTKTIALAFYDTGVMSLKAADILVPPQIMALPLKTSVFEWDGKYYLASGDAALLDGKTVLMAKVLSKEQIEELLAEQAPKAKPAPAPKPAPAQPTQPAQPAPKPAAKPKAAPKQKALTLEEGLKAVDSFAVTAAHKKAVEAYSGSSYDPINMFLRGIDKAPYLQDKTRYDTIIKDLKDFLKSAPKITHTTYRGFGLSGDQKQKALAMLKPGEVFYDAGFMSSSHDETAAFSGNFFLTIKGKSGVPIENLVYRGVRDEREVLFPPGTRFRTLTSDLTGSSGRYTATIEEI